jgi:hypothetical protein
MSSDFVPDKRRRKRLEMGIGYIKPKSMSQSSFTSTIKKWRQKLAQSGFNDIESHTTSYNGRVIPHFTDMKSSGAFGRVMNAETQRYYELARSFTHHYDFKIISKKDEKLLKFIWHHYSEGISIRSICKVLAGETVKRSHASNSLKVPRSLKQKRGVWWVHHQIHRVMPHFETWRVQEVLSAE